MKSKRVAIAIIGISLFFSIVVTFVWFLSPAGAPQPKELNLDEAISRIRDKQIKETNFKSVQVDLIDKSGDKYFVYINNDPTREEIKKVITAVNDINPSYIKTSDEPQSSGWGWILLVSSLPFYIMWAATLAVIAYAVTVLSRNKG